MRSFDLNKLYGMTGKIIIIIIIVIVIVIVIIIVISGHLLTKVWINKETRQHRPSLYQKAAYYIVKKSL